MIAKGKTRPSAALIVDNIRFDPLRQGKNRVMVRVQNSTDQDQVFAIHIQSKTPGAGGWGRPFFENLKAHESKLAYFEFEISSMTDKSWVRLRFYNPPSEEGYQFDDYFREEKFVGSTIEQYREAPQELKDAIITSFSQFQEAIREERYRDAWELVSKEIREEHGNDFSRFEERLEGGPNYQKRMLLELKPQSVLFTSSLVILETNRDDQVWKIDFALQENGWKVLMINPSPGVDTQKMAIEQVKAAMKKRRTLHFDIHYEPGSPAARDVNTIADQREKGLQQISEFLGVPPEDRVALIFFEDATVKRQKTGHQGDGWAFGATIVEVYNEEVQLDPYHEMTHILARRLGDPPAILNEGLATYMSEYMGEPSLKHMGGKHLSLYERVRELKTKGDWIPLAELFTYTDIGPSWSRPSVAYPEAGAFVRFLVENFGKDEFIQAYRRLQNPGSDTVHQQNIAWLEEAFGISLEELRSRWYEDMGLK